MSFLTSHEKFAPSILYQHIDLMVHLLNSLLFWFSLCHLLYSSHYPFLLFLFFLVIFQFDTLVDLYVPLLVQAGIVCVPRIAMSKKLCTLLSLSLCWFWLCPSKVEPVFVRCLCSLLTKVLFLCCVRTLFVFFHVLPHILLFLLLIFMTSSLASIFCCNCWN